MAENNSQRDNLFYSNKCYDKEKGVQLIGKEEPSVDDEIQLSKISERIQKILQLDERLWKWFTSGYHIISYGNMELVSAFRYFDVKEYQVHIRPLNGKCGDKESWRCVKNSIGGCLYYPVVAFQPTVFDFIEKHKKEIGEKILVAGIAARLRGDLAEVNEWMDFEPGLYGYQKDCIDDTWPVIQAKTGSTWSASTALFGVKDINHINCRCTGILTDTADE